MLRSSSGLSCRSPASARAACSCATGSWARSTGADRNVDICRPIPVSVDAGRRSYDNSIEAWGGKGPFGDVPCFVVTHRPPASADPVFTFVTAGIQSALEKAQEVAGDKSIGLMGANVDQQFLAEGLVDEIRIHLVNVLLGGGRRLFDRLPQRIELEQTGLSRDDDVTHLEYRVLR